MKNKGCEGNQLGMQEVTTLPYVEVIPAMGSLKEHVNHLELAMTNSAFGYEYALNALEEEGDYGMRAEQLRVEVDNHKSSYFQARDQLKVLDADHLNRFEFALKLEKSVVFAKSEHLH